VDEMINRGGFPNLTVLFFSSKPCRRVRESSERHRENPAAAAMRKAVLEFSI